MAKINKLQIEFIDAASCGRHSVKCRVSLPSAAKTPWPVEVYDVCPRGDLYYRLDGGEEISTGISGTWQFDENGESWPSYWSVTDKFTVTKPFRVLELFVHAADTVCPDFCIGRVEVTFPVALTLDLKKRVYSSRVRRGGRYETLSESWEVTEGTGRAAGAVANDVLVTFGAWYGHRISEICKTNPDYAVWLMSTGSAGSDSANANLQSCQAYIDAHFDWKSHRDAMRAAAEKRASEALAPGTVIAFTGTCRTKEKPYGRVSSWVRNADRLNFDCIMISCDDGKTLRVNKKLAKLSGRVSGTAVVEKYWSGSDVYVVTGVKNVKSAK